MYIAYHKKRKAQSRATLQAECRQNWHTPKEFYKLCKFCNGVGHVANDCPEAKKWNKSKLKKIDCRS